MAMSSSCSSRISIIRPWKGLTRKHGPLALIGSRTKLMQHWADRIDHWLDAKKVMPIKRGTQADALRFSPEANADLRAPCLTFYSRRLAGGVD